MPLKTKSTSCHGNSDDVCWKGRGYMVRICPSFLPSSLPASSLPRALSPPLRLPAYPLRGRTLNGIACFSFTPPLSKRRELGPGTVKHTASTRRGGLLQDSLNVVSTFCPRRIFPSLFHQGHEKGFGASSLWKQRTLRWNLSWPCRLPSEIALALFYDAGSWVGNVLYRFDLFWFSILISVSSL